MKKIHILLFTIIFTAALGCKKGSGTKPTNPTTTKTYLLTSITEYTNSDPKIITDFTYSYDAQNKLIQIVANANTYKYTYDGAGNLTAAGIYQNNALTQSRTFTYSTDSIKVKYYKSDGSYLNSFSYALTNNRITKAVYSDGAIRSQQYDYDGNGNVSVFTITVSDGTKVKHTFSYDQKKNPFSMIGGNNPKLIYFLIETGFTYSSGNSNAMTNVNNLTANTMGSVQNSNLSGTTTTYNYNSDGFPLGARVALTEYVYNAYVTYNYIVK